MTLEELIHWLHGVVKDETMNVNSRASLIIRKVREVAGQTTPAPDPRAKLVKIPLARFCIHNVALVEACWECKGINASDRLMGVIVSSGTEHIYVDKWID